MLDTTRPPETEPPTSLRLLLLLAFFLSGAAALVYQVLWTRQLGLVFGVTIQAASTVLACFMGGLALGSYAAGWLSDRVTRPLRTFAWVEVGIGLCALFVPAALAMADAFFLRIAPSLAGAPVLTTLARLSLTAVVLLVPATFMGMTYPLVLRAASRTASGIRRTASLLYAVNTTGAIAGVLVGSLWLVPALGLRQTSFVAVGLNLLVALVAWGASRAERPLPGVGAGAAADETAATVPVGTRPLTPAARATVLVVIALSGAVSLALEIVWFRILVFFLRPTTYAFASMLVAVLAGLALGSYLVTPWLRRQANWLAILGLAELGVAIAGLVSAQALSRGNEFMGEMFTVFEALPPPYDFVLPLFAAAAFAILPTAMLLGAAFPLGLVLWTTGRVEGDDRVGRRVGTLYALNVAGAIAGSLAGGFVLVPLFGAQVSLVVVTAVPLVGGLVLLWMSGARGRLPSMAAATAAFVLISTNMPDVFQDVIVSRYPGHRILWHAEDAQATVSVVEHGETRVLLIDGMHHASDGPDMVGFHRAIGALAVAVHPDPRDILVIGMGGGTSAGGASILPNARTTVVELSPSVVQAGVWFERINRKVLENPNVTFEVADGRHFLKTTTRKFDIITADLMLPHLSGAANLYSSDYFALAREALAPGGIMVQWIPADTEFQHKLMLRSFTAAFPEVTMWMGGGIVIGSNEPVRLRPRDFDLKVTYPVVRAVFDEIGIGTFDALVRQYFTGRAAIDRYLGEGPTLRDDRPIIEYFLAMPTGSPPVDLAPFAGTAAEILGETREPAPPPGR